MRRGGGVTRKEQFEARANLVFTPGAYLPDEIAEKEAETLRANLRGDTKLRRRVVGSV
jgi:hypothetical protein